MGVRVGFFKFLKKEKRQDANELDLPPEPPPLEGFGDNHEFPDFPEIKADDLDLSKLDIQDFGKAGSYEQQSQEAKSKFSPDFQESGEADDMPGASEPELVQPLPAPDAQPVPPPEQNEAMKSEPEHMQKARRLFHHERKSWERPSRKEVYVRVDKFKGILDGISLIKASVRKSDEALMRLENIKNSKDRSFDKVRASLEDLQRKLIFIDRTLFKGG
ncbi:hypothetical protein HY637_05770 [Candidatus Woesearchaeota archaeon]|nr:hypothetical protein [Candidatus Woesearchaeota archaeon]